MTDASGEERVTETLEAPATEVRRTKPKKAKKEEKSYGKKAKVGALWSVGRQTVSQVLNIPTTVILARLLSPADFGIAAAAALFIQLAKKMGNMGLNTALVRMKDVREEHRASVFVVNMAVGLLAWVILMVAAPSIGDFYGDGRVTSAVRVASLVFLVNFLGAVEYATLQREMRFKEMAYVEWASPLTFFPVSVGLAWAGWGYWSLILGQVAASLAVTGSKVYFGLWRPSLAVTRRGLAETIPFGLGIYAKRLLMYAAENLDSLIVGGVFGVTWLGYYDKAFNAAGNMSDRLSLGSTVMFRIFAIIQEERDRFVRAYRKVVLAGTITTFPIFAGLIVAAREFIVVVFGQKWEPAIVPFQFLCGAGALRLVLSYSSATVQASGRIWAEVWRKSAQVVLIGVLIFAFRPWGIRGAAFAVLLATLILALQMQGLVKRMVEIGWRDLYAPLWPSALAAAGTAACIGAVTAGVRYFAPGTQDWIVLVLQIAAGGVFWLGFVLFVRLPAVQDVVDEVIDDVVPAGLRRHLDRVRPRPSRIPSA